MSFINGALFTQITPLPFFSPEIGCEKLLWKLARAINTQGQDGIPFAVAIY